ncbi:lipopolysaccharide biosynthesis protein [Qipengyuania sp.]|uniref:lipopolysaccharide biosynthesis protein n=1 Tax=Qipengyuania sp. TaxID=2004515 RepID=UPI003736D685
MIAKARQYVTTHVDSLASIAIRIGGVGLGFVITLFLGKELGPEAVGQYGIITQTGMFLSMLCVGGLDLSVVRSFSEARASKRLPALNSFINVIGLLCGLLGIVMVLMFALANIIRAELLENSAIPLAIVFLSAITIARSFTRLTGSYLRSQAFYIFGNVVEILIIPVIVVMLILARITETLSSVLMATALAGLFASLVGVGVSLTRTSRSPEAMAIPMRPLIKRAVPLWGVAVSKNLSDWYSLAVVASVLSLYEAGIFRVAMQVASALPVITLGIFSVFSAKFGMAHTRGDFAEVARLARSATALSVLLVVPVGILCTIFARPLLQVFGPEFNDEFIVLQVLILGQILYVCTGPSGLVLAMTGNERINLLFTVVSLAALLVLLPLTARYVGLLGMVIVMSVILVIRNLASLAAVRRLTGVNILTGKYHPAARG